MWYSGCFVMVTVLKHRKVATPEDVKENAITHTHKKKKGNKKGNVDDLQC